ncbi:hypothetical protein A2690_04525 [Candidatus Roizmanbacteria bacterium RIFCSPHIGHO2_01_FULL_39_12b]|uniref:Uncharacterized protein n=1 Tax=Candidatus Roizmanbacteria bacterium RIFCSPHIGHO2_01_FULL_39_12b TaxID=1802030 RepID=A0A1F7GAG6_9BACT|nr:MAG: hypothetical protein A2690_04525 [Candidatus Roizmanbacteria bacterium RIFCSPHIGHO2_01_FULL_39_12b]
MIDSQTEISRREVLKRLAAFSGGAIVGSVGGESAQLERPSGLDNRIFKDGETIPDPEVPTTIHGWNLRISEDSIAHNH